MVSSLTTPKYPIPKNLSIPKAPAQHLHSETQFTSIHTNGKKEANEKMNTAKISELSNSKKPSILAKSSDSNQFSKFAFGSSQSDSEKQFEEEQRTPFIDKGGERATLRTPGAGKPTGRNEARMEWLDDIKDSNGK